MISDAERRKVAAQLRAIPHINYFGHDSINPTDLWRTIGFLRTVDGRIPTAEVRHLADLIDRPTCTNEGDEYGFHCSNCDELLSITKEIPSHAVDAPYMPSYCPHCGRKVVGGDES